MGATRKRRKIYFWLFAMYPEEGLLKVPSSEILGRPIVFTDSSCLLQLQMLFL
jgi:hypothetical protein